MNVLFGLLFKDFVFVKMGKSLLMLSILTE